MVWVPSFDFATLVREEIASRSHGHADVGPGAVAHWSLPHRAAGLHAIGGAGAGSRRLAHGGACANEAD